ncbi:hypothetical protein B0H16DRAFT_1265982, partial [Mycena metata]
KLHLNLNGTTHVLLLRGIIYYGSFHFTPRIIGTDGRVWFHDGMTTRQVCTDEPYLE